GGLVILKGNLAPQGAVVKVAGSNLPNPRGPARGVDGEEGAPDAGRGEPSKPGGGGGDGGEGTKGGAGQAGVLRGAGPIGRGGAGRVGGHGDRREIFRRDARPDGGARGARGGRWWTDCRDSRGRHDRVRHSEPDARRRAYGRGDRLAVEGVEGAGAALRERRD